MTKSIITDNENAAISAPQALRLLKTATAKKLGKRSEGSISYRLLSDPERQHLYLTITGNDGGGYFSRETVSFSQVEACLNKRLESDKPFPSKLFKDAFVGRSSNNAGFMAAVLRNEGLLTSAPEVESQHVAGCDWAAWQITQLALPGEPLELPATAPLRNDVASTFEDVNASSEKKSRTLTLKHPASGSA